MKILIMLLTSQLRRYEAEEDADDDDDLAEMKCATLVYLGDDERDWDNSSSLPTSPSVFYSHCLVL